MKQRAQEIVEDVVMVGIPVLCELIVVVGFIAMLGAWLALRAGA
jgi:hypothetical protein